MAGNGSQGTLNVRREMDCTWTQVPNFIFERWLSVLTHRELAVLLYLVRCTWGFGGYPRKIPIRQIAEGWRPLSGQEKTDFGTGLPHRSVEQVLKFLITIGLVKKERQFDPSGTGLPSLFEIDLHCDVDRALSLIDEARTLCYKKGRREGEEEDPPSLVTGGGMRRSQRPPPGHW